MKAVTVRDLKNNPSATLPEAREHPVVVLQHNRPEAVLVHLDEDPSLNEQGIRQALATALYRDRTPAWGWQPSSSECHNSVSPWWRGRRNLARGCPNHP